MLKFTGNGDYTKVNIRIYGDGVSTDLPINLGDAPFFLNWKSTGQGLTRESGQGQPFYPKDIDIADIGGSPAPNVTMQESRLNITFPEPPAAAVFGRTPDPYPTPAISFTVNFIYGTQIT